MRGRGDAAPVWSSFLHVPFQSFCSGSSIVSILLSPCLSFKYKPPHPRLWFVATSDRYLPVPVLGLDEVGEGLGLLVRGVAVAVTVVVVVYWDWLARI